MNVRSLLLAILAVHGALLIVASLALGGVGLSARDVLVGGGVIAGSFCLLWALGGALLRSGRKSTVALLGALKTLAYVALMATLVRGATIDGAAFASGVTCFVVAAVVVALGARGRGLTPVS